MNNEQQPFEEWCYGLVGEVLTVIKERGSVAGKDTIISLCDQLSDKHKELVLEAEHRAYEKFRDEVKNIDLEHVTGANFDRFENFNEKVDAAIDEIFTKLTTQDE